MRRAAQLATEPTEADSSHPKPSTTEGFLKRFHAGGPRFLAHGHLPMGKKRASLRVLWCLVVKRELLVFSVGPASEGGAWTRILGEGARHRDAPLQRH